MPFLNVDNTRRASEYLLDQLSQGTTLSRLVRESVDFSLGRIRVAIPPGMKASEDLDFRYETFPLRQTGENDFARLLKSFISTEECDVILQDTQISMSDPGIADLPWGKLAIPYRKEVYWNVADAELANLSDEEMSGLISHASFWPFSAFFYIDQSSQPKDELNDADLQFIVKQLVGVAVGAFDDRSYLVWWRDDLRPFPLVS